MTATISRQICPVCDSELNSGAAQCLKCRTDLRLHAPTSEIALNFYNEGIDLARAGDRQGAEAKMRGALAADPDLLDASIVLGKLLAQTGETGDLERAVACWTRARSARPSIDQSRKLDHCIETASARLSDARVEAESARRGNSVLLVAVGLFLATVCGVIGYLLRPLQSTVAIAPAGSHGQTAPTVPSVRALTPGDPIAAIEKALNRPDIVVGRNGKSFVLHGTVQTDAEKRLSLAAAALAAGTNPGLVDGSDLRVKQSYTRVGAKRVEHMLHMFVRVRTRNTDPLRNASKADHWQWQDSQCDEEQATSEGQAGGGGGPEGCHAGADGGG